MTPTDIRQTAERDRGVRRVLWIVLFLNAAVAVAKLTVGAMISSISMVADGFHSLTDGTSNVVGLVAMSLARRPPDADHPYGHRKFETLAALTIGALLALTAWEVLQSCFHRLRMGGEPQVSPIAFGVMAVTIAVNLGVSTWERSAGKRFRSQLLEADSQHTRSDVYASLAVIASLLAARVGYPVLDVITALLITVLIARIAFGILRDAGMLLTDTAIVPANQIEAIAIGVPGVLSVHKIRSRQDPRGGHADLHVQVAANLPLAEAHRIGHEVADRVRQELDVAEVLVHVEPPAI